MLSNPVGQTYFTANHKEFWNNIVRQSCVELYGDMNGFFEMYRKTPNKIYNDINKMLQVVPITLRKLIEEIFMREYGGRSSGI